MAGILTIEEIKAAPSLKWDALIEWRDKIDAKLDEISEAVGEGEWHDPDLYDELQVVLKEHRRWQAAEQKMLTC